MHVDQLSAVTGANRFDLWVNIINRNKFTSVVEIGVWKGEFAAHLLTCCPNIKKYYMIDPWQHLDGWNKPFNVDDTMFDGIYREAIQRTEFAADRRTVLRGRTTEVIDAIPDGSVDFVYIDGDHTLKGISIDLLRTFPKLKAGGLLGGDDYSSTIWQHADTFEPTLVCPFATYFAEAVGTPIVIFDHNQFAMPKPDGFGEDFRIIDTTGRYGPPYLGDQISPKTSEGTVPTDAEPRPNRIKSLASKLVGKWSAP